MEKNKTGKYLKYAVGEIVLVVIGILIALNVSNFNEKRKNTIAFETHMDNLEEALTINLDEATSEINQFYDFMSIQKLILENKVKRGELKLDEILDSSLLDLNDSDISPLLDNQDSFPEKYKNLIPLLKMYQTLKNRQSIDEQSLVESEKNYRNYLISNQNWYGSNNENSKEQELDFYQSNPIFKNFVKSHREVTFYNTREMIGIRSSAIVILTELKRIRNAFNDKEIKQFFIAKGLNQLAELDCNIKIPLEEDNWAQELPVGFIPIYNSLNKKVSFYKVNNDGSINKSAMEINPKQLTINFTSQRVVEDMVIEIHIEDQCYKKYQIKKDRFLFIE